MDDATLRTAQQVLEEHLAQPALFLQFDGVEGVAPPAKPDGVQRYTGERAAADDEKLLRVGMLRLLGASDREIEAAVGVTRRTIPVLLRHLEKSGRITPLKQRLAELCADNAERANIALRILLDKIGAPGTGAGDTDLASMIASVTKASDVATKNTLLLTGQATEIVERRAGSGREQWDVWWQETMKEARATDLESSGSPAIPVQSESSPVLSHGTDTPTSAGTPAPAPDLAPPSDRPDRGGGGPPEGAEPKTPMS